MPRGVADGLDEVECSKCVASVYQTCATRTSSKNGASTSAGVGAVHGRATEEAAPLPQLTPEKLPSPILDGLPVLVETLFKPGEGIAIGAGLKGASGNLVIDRGVVRRWDGWRVALQKRSLEQMNHAGNGGSADLR